MWDRRACMHNCVPICQGPGIHVSLWGSDHLCSAAWELWGLSWDKVLSWLFIFPQLPVLPLPDGDSPTASWDSGVGSPWARLTSGHMTLGPGGLGAPPGSGSQAPGQLVAISSTDYLVAIPSGARALSPAPQETLLAGVWGFLGQKRINVCTYVRARSVWELGGRFCRNHLCLCAHACMHCSSVAFSAHV